VRHDGALAEYCMGLGRNVLDLDAGHGAILALLASKRKSGSAHCSMSHSGAVTERKPPGMRFETWVERQIREAQERGEFDNLPGTGKPLPGLTGHYDELWWVKQVAQREHLSLLPPLLALRKEAELLLDGLSDLRSEAEGPPVALPRRLDADEVVAEWARRRAGPPTASKQSRSAGEGLIAIRHRLPWWRRLTRRGR
jgi:hypothetical protein